MTASVWVHDKVNHLQVRSGAGDQPVLRLQLMQSLAGVDFRPAGMSPSSILLIRYLKDPLPGRLLSNHNAKSAWKMALRNSLDNLYRQAAKPQGGRILGQPDAVLFRDKAELLACLVGDIHRHNIAHKWWWHQQAVTGGTVSHQIGASLLREVRYVPAVFSHLAENGLALAVVKNLDAVWAEQILAAVLQEYDLGTLARAISDDNGGSITVDSGRTVADDEVFAEENSFNERPANTAEARHQYHIHPNSPPPWLTLCRGEIWQSDLTREQAALLGVARSLATNPGILSNKVFQQQVMSWWQQFKFDAIDEHLSATASNPILSFRSRAREPAQNAVLLPREDTLDVERSKQDEPRADRPELASELMADGGEDSDPSLESTVQSRQKQEMSLVPHTRFGREKTPVSLSTTALPKIQEAKQTGAVTDKLEIDAISRSTKVTTKTLPEEVLESDTEVNLHFSDTFIDTQLGGVIFIINLLHQLGLPECFENDWALNRQLSPWALVDVLARALLATDFPANYQDPVWRVLAKLDRRKTKLAIGSKFRGCPNYRLPKAWYEWMTSQSDAKGVQFEKVYWAIHHHKLRLWTDRIVVSEVPFTGDPEVQCMREMRQYDPAFQYSQLTRAGFGCAPVENRSQLQRNGLNCELAHWAARVTPFVRFFLGNQLQMYDTTPRQLTKEWMYLQARIYCSSSHIDLVTGVENTRLNVRLAGLDQNPGWLPLYGRVVLLHFTSV